MRDVGGSETEPGTGIAEAVEVESATAMPWEVLIHNDPVNLMSYVTMVIRRVFGYDEGKATRMMLEVHHEGRSTVWCGEREKAELYVQQLQGFQLLASMQKAER